MGDGIYNLLIQLCIYCELSNSSLFAINELGQDLKVYRRLSFKSFPQKTAMNKTTQRIHSRPQSLRSFWPAAGIERLWEQPFQAYAIDEDFAKPDGQNSVIFFVISKWNNSGFTTFAHCSISAFFTECQIYTGERADRERFYG